MFSSRFVALVGLASFVPNAWAGYNPSAKDNIAVYWGQNSAQGATTQSRLATYCASM